MRSRHLLVGILLGLIAMAAGRMAWVSFSGTQAKAANAAAPQARPERVESRRLESELEGLRASVRDLQAELSRMATQAESSANGAVSDEETTGNDERAEEPQAREQAQAVAQENRRRALELLDATLTQSGLDRASTVETREGAEAAIAANQLPCELRDVSCSNSLCKATIRDASPPGEMQQTLSSLTHKPPFATHGRVFMPEDGTGDIKVFFSRPGHPFPEI